MILSICLCAYVPGTIYTVKLAGGVVEGLEKHRDLLNALVAESAGKTDAQVC